MPSPKATLLFPSCALVLTVLLQPLQVLSQTVSTHDSPDKTSETLITFAAQIPVPKARALPMKMGGISPSGHDIEVTDRYLTLDGAPWLPVMGEFHFSRYPAADWEDELLKMKAGGIDIVSTYVMWNHHEELQGHFDWSGRKDLRHFVELCAKHGLYSFVRIGPYAHGEVRRGGLPDWLVAEGPVRRNTPAYLEHVKRFYGEIGRQLHGLLWKEGGPVIGIQIENEYLLHGPDAGAAHIGKLKTLALAEGLDAPIFTVTGWGDADFPPDQVIPVHGVYPDAFWDSSLQDLPPSDADLFDLHRDSGGILADPQGTQKTSEQKLAAYPLLLAEAGGGMQVAYHRRPAIRTDDVAAILVTHLGSGANLYGYYMFHGGANPVGRRTTLQESAAIDGVYDLPVISYDFQAPLGEFGQVRPSYRTLKLFHFFLNEFGSELAPMIPATPNLQPHGAEDRTTPRAALRTDGEHAFLFFNNYLRDYPMAEQKQLRFSVQLQENTIELPSHPVDIPSGAYFIWPLNLSMQGATLRYATAQLICSVSEHDEPYYFFEAVPGVAPEFSFEAQSVRELQVAHGDTAPSAGQILVQAIQPGTKAAFTLLSSSGKKLHVVVLTAEQARDLWEAPFAAQPHVFLSPADLFFNADELVMRSRDAQSLFFGIFPGSEIKPESMVPLAPLAADGIFARYGASLATRKIEARWALLQKPSSAPPVKRGKYNAVAPTDADFAHAAVWNIHVPHESFSDLSNLFLQFDYQGDVARLYKGRELLDDNFYNGRPWEVGLKHFLAHEGTTSFRLEITPLRQDAPIYLPSGAWPQFVGSDQVAAVQHIRLLPEYQVTARLFIRRENQQ
jgi:hypothetical protein